MLKPGGILVYSTCTISPKENEVQVVWFLEKFKEFELKKQVNHSTLADKVTVSLMLVLCTSIGTTCWLPRPGENGKCSAILAE